MDIYSKQLRELARSVGVEVDDHQAGMLMKHLKLVIEANKSVNLTRITSIEDALVLHIVDSLSAFSAISKRFAPSDNTMRFLDMGTGAGYPGIPLLLMSTWNGTLLDSVGKKIKAVERFAADLDISNGCYVHARLEEFAQKHKHSFDVVVARAVASLPVLVEYATPFLKDHGCLYVMKARPSDEELASGDAAAQICGLRPVESYEFELPCNLGHREVYVFEKTRPSRVALPRQNGKARREPLA